MIAYRKLVPVYPNVHLAIMACEDCDEVQIVHPAARAVEQIRAIVDVVKYRSDRGGQRALLLHPAQLSRGAIHALVKTLEARPAHARIAFVSGGRQAIPEALRKWV